MSVLRQLEGVFGLLAVNFFSLVGGLTLAKGQIVS
jgi:hypothetical protein